MPKLLSVKMFGGLEVALGEKKVADFGYDKVRALLAYLLLEPPTPHSRDVLAGTFWPEQPEEMARHSLRQALSDLRSTLGKYGAPTSLFLATRTAIQRNPNAAVETDVDKFEGCLSSRVGQRDEVGRLQCAAGLYRGELLRGLSLCDTESFSEWIQIKREHYQSQAVAALDRLVRHCDQLGDYEAGCRHAQQLVSLEPWREDAHRVLMLMLARMGQRTAALKQYELCQNHLREALDVTPELETERVRRKIQQMGSHQKHLPVSLTGFVGRQPEMRMLTGFLTDRTRRLITVTGLGGVGKSRLATEVGARMAEGGCRRFLHGVVFVSLASVQSVDHLIAAIAQHLGLTFSAGKPMRPQLVGFLQEMELLLILDNFEQLIGKESLELVSAILDSAPEVKLLVTSRSALDLQGEQLVPLTGLPTSSGALKRSSSRRNSTGEGTAAHLFMSAVRTRRPDFNPSREDVASLLEICRTVEGMPLAIELTAACTERLSLVEVRNQIERNLNLLESSYPNIPERHRSIRAVFEASWRQLNDTDQRVLARLAVFRGGFTREAAQEVAEADHRSLARISRHSLLQQDTERCRYHLHELLRQFAAERMGAEETGVTLDRHSDYFCRQLHTLAPGLSDKREEATLRQIDEDFDNMRRAWRRAIDCGATETINAAAAGLHHYLTRRGRYNEAAAILEGVPRSLGKKRPSRQEDRVLARLLAFHGDVLAETGQNEEATKLLQQSLQLIGSPVLRRQDLRAEQALALFRLAFLTDNADQALPLLERSLALYREIGDLGQVASVLASLGLLLKSAGKLEKAEACFEEGLTLRRTLDNPGLTAEVSCYLGELRLRQGRLQESLRVHQEGLELARSANDLRVEGRALFSLTAAYFYAGEFRRAEATLRRGMRLEQQTGCSARSPETTYFLGWSLVNQGRYQDGGAVCERVAEAIRGSEMHPHRGLVLTVAGAAALGEGQAARARDLLIRAVDDLGAGWQVDWHGRRSMTQAVLVCALCHLNDLDSARAALISALQTALEVRSLIAVLLLLPGAALFYQKRGDARKAAEIYSIARVQPIVARSRWFADVIGSQMPEQKDRSDTKARCSHPSPSPAKRLWQMAEQLAKELDQAPTSPTEPASTWKPGTPSSTRTTPGPAPGNRSAKRAAFVT